MAGWLIALGVAQGTHVGLLYPNGVQFVVGMLAAARIGTVVVPFSTFGTAPQLRRQLLDSDVTVLVATRSYRTHDHVATLEICAPNFGRVAAVRACPDQQDRR